MYILVDHDQRTECYAIAHKQHAWSIEQLPDQGIILEKVAPLTEIEATDYVQTVLDQRGPVIDSEVRDQMVRDMLNTWMPAIGKGVARGLISYLNPANIILDKYYKLKMAAELIGFVGQEAFYLGQYAAAKAQGDQTAADTALAQCSQPFKDIAAGWVGMDQGQRIEVVSQICTEFLAGSNKSLKGIRDLIVQSTKKEVDKAKLTILQKYAGREAQQLEQQVAGGAMKAGG